MSSWLIAVMAFYCGAGFSIGLRYVCICGVTSVVWKLGVILVSLCMWPMMLAIDVQHTLSIKLSKPN